MKKLVIIFMFFFLFSLSVKANERIEVKFSKCVDGDTIKLKINGKKKRVRLLAIDTPESVTPDKPVEKYGKEASELTCKLVKNAKKIEIEYDSNSDKEDKYGRVLAYVYVDDVMLQKELLSNGLAKVAYLYNDYLYTEEFKSIQEEAKNKEIGIWSLDDPNYEIIDEEEDNAKEESFFKRLLKEIGNFFKKVFNYIKDLF